MCLIAIAYRVDPDYPMIIAANRDEFFSRETAPLAFWDDFPDVLAGRDLEGRGTWLGVSRSGRIAAVTNYREPDFKARHRRSRGLLVSDYLTGDDPPGFYLLQVAAEKEKYAGFNLIAGDRNKILWYSNRADRIVEFAPGIHVVSNHLLDTPWPKVEKTRKRLSEMIENRTVDPESIFGQILADRTRPDDARLPDTGVGLEWERVLSSPFVASLIYGTRSSSIITADAAGTLVFLERTFGISDGEPVVIETRRYVLQALSETSLRPHDQLPE